MTKEFSTESLNLEYVYPKLELPWIKRMVEDYNEMHDTELPSCSKISSIGDLDEKIQKVLYDVFVSHSLASHFALKYRFLGFMKYSNTWNKYETVEDGDSFGEVHPDIVLQDPSDKSLIWVFFNEIFDENILRSFRTTCGGVRGSANADYVASKIVFISKKSHREITEDDPIIIKIAENQNQSWSVPFEIWIEENNSERPFNDDDLLIVKDQEYAGFNFSSINDFLDVIKSTFGNGQYEIIRVSNFFGSRNANKSNEKEIIWKGIIFPKKFFK